MYESVRERTTRHGVAVAETAVREELQRVLESAEFSSSKRCQEFLRYVVDKTLAGHADDLKERTIGVELLGRPTTYEPSIDASVRVKAGEVRKRLHLYYNGAGLQAGLRIDLPAGGYVPEFLPAAAPPVALPSKETGFRPSRSRKGWILAGLVIISVGAGALVVSMADRVGRACNASGVQRLAMMPPYCFAFLPSRYMVSIRTSKPERERFPQWTISYHYRIIS